MFIYFQQVQVQLQMQQQYLQQQIAAQLASGVMNVTWIGVEVVYGVVYVLIW